MFLVIILSNFYFLNLLRENYLGNIKRYVLKKNFIKLFFVYLSLIINLIEWESKREIFKGRLCNIYMKFLFEICYIENYLGNCYFS